LGHQEPAAQRPEYHDAENGMEDIPKVVLGEGGPVSFFIEPLFVINFIYEGIAQFQRKNNYDTQIINNR
jgi:hypothetical protein